MSQSYRRRPLTVFHFPPTPPALATWRRLLPAVSSLHIHLSRGDGDGWFRFLFLTLLKCLRENWKTESTSWRKLTWHSECIRISCSWCEVPQCCVPHCTHTTFPNSLGWRNLPALSKKAKPTIGLRWWKRFLLFPYYSHFDFSSKFIYFLFLTNRNTYT